MPEADTAKSEFEVSRDQARKAQVAMNVLVIFSSVAASVFLFYVLFQMQPFGSRGGAEVDIATSAVPASIPALRGTIDAGLEVELRDLDEADAYRDKLNETMRKSLGVEAQGRFFRLWVHCAGKGPVSVDSPALELRDSSGAVWHARWLAGIADRATATPVGRLALEQAAAEYALDPGQSRQLMVFVPGQPPALGGMVSGTYSARGLRVDLARDDHRTASQ